jgi:uncharacterized protein YjeT (DUF2065 family)
MPLLVKIIGILLVLEGIPWFLSPSGTKNLLRSIMAVPDRYLRLLGLTLMLLGVFVVYLATG